MHIYHKRDACGSGGEKLNVTTNELTWAIRHTNVTADVVIKTNGTVVINYNTSDVLDLTPQENRSFNYNAVSFLTGTLYHGIGGNSMDMESQVNWSETIDLTKQ